MKRSAGGRDLGCARLERSKQKISRPGKRSTRCEYDRAFPSPSSTIQSRRAPSHRAARSMESRWAIFCWMWESRRLMADSPDGEPWDEAVWTAFAEELAAWRVAGRTAGFWWRDDDAGRADSGLD